jgi:hypothetical protein
MNQDPRLQSADYLRWIREFETSQDAHRLIGHIDAQAERIAALTDALDKEQQCAERIYQAMDKLNVHHRDVHHEGGRDMPVDLDVVAGYRAWGMHLFIRPKVRALLGGEPGSASPAEVVNGG